MPTVDLDSCKLNKTKTSKQEIGNEQLDELYSIPFPATLILLAQILLDQNPIYNIYSKDKNLFITI
jgi:hypothetical protein